MNTRTIQINIPQDISRAINETDTELRSDIKISLALWFYLNQKLTLAKAARFAGYSKLEFENILSDMQIPISLYTTDDIENQLDSMRDL